MPLEKKLFVKWADQSKIPAAVYTPKNLKAGEKCALICFTNGVGEAGDGTLNQLDKMLNNPFANGPITFAQKVDDFAFVHPLDTTQLIKFIVISFQGKNGWAAFAPEIQNALTMGILKDYPVDPNMIFITGLSAGGQETMNAISGGPNPELFAAAVPFSPASQGQDLSLVVKNNVKVWALSGNLDGMFTDNAKAIYSRLHALKPGIAGLTIYSGGHGGWQERYDPNYKEEFRIKNEIRRLNIYEWMLLNSKAATVVDTPKPPIEEPKVPAPPPPPVKTSGVSVESIPDAIKIDGVPDMFELDGSSAPGKGGYWQMQFAKPKEVWTEGHGVKLKVFKLPAGIWPFSFTDQDGFSRTISKPVKVTVGTPKVPVVLAKYEVKEIMSDGTPGKTVTLPKDSPEISKLF